MLANLQGLDHVVVLVRDLDAAAASWRRLGFTVSPRGLHSPHLGTGNHTVMLGQDYIELLGIVAPTPHNEASRALLAEREGVERVAFTARDAAGLAAELRERGLSPTGPLDFGRPVERPDGSLSEARFRTVHWPPDERPGALRLFACQHLTPENVWLPELTRHANTAFGIERVEAPVVEPRSAAEHLAGLIGAGAEPAEEGAWRVETSAGRASLVFLDEARRQGRGPSVAVDAARGVGVIGLVLRVRDLDEAARSVEGAVRSDEGDLLVPASLANGVALRLVERRSE